MPTTTALSQKEAFAKDFCFKNTDLIIINSLLQSKQYKSLDKNQIKSSNMDLLIEF